MIQKCSLWRVLEVFFKEPTRVHYVRGISRNIHLAPTSIKKHILTLLKQDIIIKKKELFIGYSANLENENFIFHKRISNQINIKTSGLLKYLIDNTHPETIILYGSYSRGEDREHSDIDLFILTKNSKQLNLEKFEKELKREIHIIIEKDSRNLNPNLRENLKNGFVIYGYLK